MINRLSPSDYMDKEVAFLRNNASLSLDFKQKLDLICENYKKTLASGKSFYRARRYLNEDRFEKYHNPQNYTDNRFFGHDKENSFVNKDPSKIPEGRVNFKGTPYLYGAFDIDTSILETKSCANTAISVAEIKVIEDLNIVDLCVNFGISADQWESEFLMTLCSRFSNPVYNDNDYLLTQHISEYMKNNKGFDGIAYLSAFYIYDTYAITKKGKNITIFNYDKCEPLSSNLYFLKGFEVKHVSYR